MKVVLDPKSGIKPKKEYKINFSLTRRTANEKKIELLKRQLKIVSGLPHLYGFKDYRWSRDFIASKKKHNFLVAANQIGKSTTQIRKAILWATSPKLWDTLWKKRPSQFWYLYPTLDVATIEFYKKWVPDILPRNEYKLHPTLGWMAEKKGRNIFALHFNTGVSIFFKSYSQKASDLQTGTCWAVFTDEEMPAEIYDEVYFRLAATSGYFHMVFTATRGEPIWYETMECIGTKQERFKDAWKQSVSLYECQEYVDGTSSHWTDKKIRELTNACRSNSEVLRRIYGRFVVEENLIYPSFSKEKNVIEPYFLGNNLLYYAAVDIGSGGKTSHPAAIVIVAVNREFSHGWVVKCWRGDGEQTTALDIYEKYKRMTEGMVITTKYYDYASREFGIITERLGDYFIPADKSHERGEQILNVLFKNEMLSIFNNVEGNKLVNELITVRRDIAKNKSHDDLIDALRYACVNIPWDFSKIKTDETIESVRERMSYLQSRERLPENSMSQEELMDLFGSDQDDWGDYYE